MIQSISQLFDDGKCFISIAADGVPGHITRTMEMQEKAIAQKPRFASYPVVFRVDSNPA